MTNIDYTDPKYKEAAYAIAEAAPRHLDQPTSPPIHWRLELDEDGKNPILRVLLADGRTVREPLPTKVGTKHIASPKLMALPAHDPTLPPANLKVDGKRKPAQHKAGTS